MKRLVLALLAAFAILASAPPAAHATDPSLVINEIKQRGVLHYPVMSGEEPDFIKDPATGEWSGFYPDWGRQIADLLQVKIEFVETTWGNLAADFLAGRLDLAFGVNPNPKRGLVVDYVLEPIVEGVWTVLARDGFEPRSWRDLNKPEVRLVAQSGSTMQVIAETMAPQATIVLVKNRDQAVLELRSGRGDAIVLADQNAAQLHKAGIGHAIVPSPVLRNPMMTAVPRKDGNQGFINLLANWSMQQRTLGLSCALITKYMAQRGIDLSVVPQSGKYC
ncbi:transporter substrate-binding domain-containing protein [Starkeya sp. ORNL1]|uniref:transporter substrate-binding domain-containing protein n=1 Tax=Starkeya sp. ORNL1 TaxID=2709380 RepID=UPI0014641264|nr:transporter substrate-binding domain-containing protein [Starkeya sp. ORNL1]QJP16871.1 transporter substrate-binding domain-containing protein [Starkeya sp. ORNL1]